MQELQNQLRQSPAAQRIEPVRSPQTPKPNPPSTPAPAKPRRRWGWLKSWQLWGSITVLMMTGMGALAIALLLKIPALPNCPAIFWPTASASLRMYCAEIAANKRTVNDLLEAIRLLEDLPPDHPMRAEIDRQVESWSALILELADEAFHGGDLEGAIAMAQQIPAHLAASDQVEAQIKEWQLIWAEGEDIYRQVEAELRTQNFQAAFRTSNQLLNVNNTYWQTTQHERLQTLITSARRDGSVLTRAKDLADRGTVESLQEAIRLVQGISESSYVHGEARTFLAELGESMLDIAQAALDREDYEGAIALVNSIPDDLDLDEAAADFLRLASAQRYAWRGTVVDLETAIVRASQLRRDRPLYRRAQAFIQDWQSEIQDIRRLDAARQLARPGTVTALRAAIAEAQLVPDGNPREGDAAQLASNWRREIQVIEDQPILDQAIQLAQSETLPDLQAAIATAEQIGSNRALANDAAERITAWTERVQMMQDQPILDRARQLASVGAWDDAIATAQQIQSGRSLHNAAQRDITNWQNRLEGQAQLQDAYTIADSGTVAGLVSAIQVANRVPANNSSRAEADQMINTWSNQLLTAAEAQAAADIQGAIAIAQSIPPRTEAYAAAQLRIQAWQQQLDTAPPPSEP